MEKEYKVTINKLSQSDMEELFNQAFDILGIKSGELIPVQYFEIRETILTLMFNKKDNK